MGWGTENEVAEDRIHQGMMRPIICPEFRLQGSTREKSYKGMGGVTLQKALSSRSRVLTSHGEPLNVFEKRSGMLSTMH